MFYRCLCGIASLEREKRKRKGECLFVRLLIGFVLFVSERSELNGPKFYTMRIYQKPIDLMILCTNANLLSNGES